jgi:predicted oxidoreductase
VKAYRLSNTDLTVSRIAYGCAFIGGTWDREPVRPDALLQATRLIHTAYDEGITLFDTADVYSFGKSEAVLGRVLKQSHGLRDKIVIQTKCGTQLSWPMSEPPPEDPHRFDLSYRYIISSVEGSLRRLGTDRLDILLLHRPDALVEPDEVAKAFDQLQQSGKARYFGISNHAPSQIDLLKKSVRQPLVVNQIHLGLTHPSIITDGVDFNREGSLRLTDRYSGVAGTLDYCRLHDIQLQAYGPVRGLCNPDATPTIKRATQVLTGMAAKKNTTPTALALAWLLRHPAGIVPIMGSINPEHIIENCAADRVEVRRSEWYALLYAATDMSATRVL